MKLVYLISNSDLNLKYLFPTRRKKMQQSDNKLIIEVIGFIWNWINGNTSSFKNHTFYKIILSDVKLDQKTDFSTKKIKYLPPNNNSLGIGFID